MRSILINHLDGIFVTKTNYNMTNDIRTNFQNLFNIVSNLYKQAYDNHMDTTSPQNKLLWKEKSELYDYFLTMLEVTCRQSDIDIFIVNEQVKETVPDSMFIEGTDFCLN